MVANMNVQFAEKVKREAGIATRAVGLIATPKQAETIVADGKADMVAMARAFLDDPHWGWHAAHRARRRGRASEAIPARRPESVAGSGLPGPVVSRSVVSNAVDTLSDY